MQEHLDVYQRTGTALSSLRPARRRIVLVQRGTHFCSWCQRLPRASRTARRSCGAMSRGGRRRERRGGRLDRSAGGKRSRRIPRADRGHALPPATAVPSDGGAGRVSATWPTERPATRPTATRT